MRSSLSYLSRFMQSIIIYYNCSILQQSNLIIIEFMNKTIANSFQLKKAILNYLKGIPQKDANIHKIQQLAQSSTIDKMAAVQLYRIISNDPNHKFQNIIRVLDKKLVTYKEYNTGQKSEGEGFSLALHTQRLKTLLLYSLPYEQTVQIILEHTLTDEIRECQFLILLPLLQCRPLSFSHNYTKLIVNLLDLLQDYLITNQTSPSFISSVTKYLSNTPFKISNKLNSIISLSIDKCLPYLDFKEILMLSHYMREKSLSQWSIMGNIETSPIRKRLIYQFILNKQFSGLQYKINLPGKAWNNGNQLEQAIRYVKSFGTKEAYIDIFQTNDEDYSSSRPWQGFSTLQKVQFSTYYIEYIFTFIKNRYKQIDIFSYYKIVRTIKSFFASSAASEANQAHFQSYFTNHKINLLSLAVVIYNLGRYHAKQSQDITKLTQSYLNIIYKLMSKEYIKQLAPYKNHQLYLVYDYLYCQITDYFIEVVKGQAKPSVEQLNAIRAFLAIQKQKKFVANQYSKLLAFYKYVQSISQLNPTKFGEISDILYHEDASIDQIRQILYQFGQVSEKAIEQKDLQEFIHKFKIIKKVELQPNITVKYAIIHKEMNTIHSVFEYQEVLSDRFVYEAEGRVQENIKLYSQDRDLTLSGLWRKKFINTYYRCKYYYCRSQLQLSYKLSKVVKQAINSE